MLLFSGGRSPDDVQHDRVEVGRQEVLQGGQELFIIIIWLGCGNFNIRFHFRQLKVLEKKTPC